MENKPNSNIVYEANKEVLDTVKKIRETCHSVCTRHSQHPVQVKMVTGETFEGRIVHIDAHCLYLEVTPDARQYPYGPYGYGGYGGFGGYGGYGGYGYNPYYSTILPLVLFDLLVISLL